MVIANYVNDNQGQAVVNPSTPIPTPGQCTSPLPDELALIHTLYAALTAKDGFHDFLEALTTAINGVAAQLVVARKQPLQIDHLWHHGLSDEFLSWYLDNNMIAQDVVTNHATFQPPGLFHSALPLLPDFQPDKDYSRWENDQDMLDTAWLVVDSTDAHTFLLCVQRTVAQGPYLDTELRGLNRLVPHIRQAVQLHRQLDLRHQIVSSLATVIDLLPDPTFVLDTSGSVVCSNNAAQTLITQERSLAIEDDRFNFTESHLQDAFFRASVRIVRSSMGKEDYFSETLFLERPGRMPLAFVIRPIESQELTAGGALITVYDPVKRPLPSAEHIAIYFSLTHAEAQVCEGLVKGMDVQGISAFCGRAVSTVRFQIKQVFQKTGCSRQGELISRILSALLR